MVSYLLKI